MVLNFLWRLFTFEILKTYVSEKQLFSVQSKIGVLKLDKKQVLSKFKFEREIQSQCILAND